MEVRKNLENMADTIITAPTDESIEHYLKYDGTYWVNEPLSNLFSSISLNDLYDVKTDMSDLSPNQVLSFNPELNQWTNKSVNEIISVGTQLIQFEDVESLQPDENSLLRYSTDGSTGVWNISDGTLLSTTWDKVINKPNEYRPPYATETTMGGARIFRIGETMYIKNIPSTPPEAPERLKASGGDQTKITCTWNPPFEGDNADVFYVYRDRNLLQKNVIDSFFEDTMVEPDKEYTYYVTAVNLAGESTPSNQAIGHTFIRPSEPMGVQYTLDSNNVLVLTWTTPDIVSGDIFYKVYKDGVLMEETYEHRYTEYLSVGTYEFYITANNKYYESIPSVVLTIIA
jgi:hypothetical protein